MILLVSLEGEITVGTGPVLVCISKVQYINTFNIIIYYISPSYDMSRWLLVDLVRHCQNKKIYINDKMFQKNGYTTSTLLLPCMFCVLCLVRCWSHHQSILLRTIINYDQLSSYSTRKFRKLQSQQDRYQIKSYSVVGKYWKTTKYIIIDKVHCHLATTL